MTVYQNQKGLAQLRAEAQNILTRYLRLTKSNKLKALEDSKKNSTVYFSRCEMNIFTLLKQDSIGKSETETPSLLTENNNLTKEALESFIKTFGEKVRELENNQKLIQQQDQPIGIEPSDN